ncbi:hypothetical protein EYF80_050001 [Liparis tanakae]|uniref:Uncharacterized protein n=1 Tax=Liparis tanakae TaxID=230148 RepID=A0A4Z2FG24_9TELE|nr:hypothetical protein EYF80_050001 [Liparis tanakae]
MPISFGRPLKYEMSRAARELQSLLAECLARFLSRPVRGLSSMSLLVSNSPTLASPAVMFCRAPMAASRLLPLLSLFCRTSLYSATTLGVKQPMASPFPEAEALVGPSRRSRTEGGSSVYSCSGGLCSQRLMF